MKYIMKKKNCFVLVRSFCILWKKGHEKNGDAGGTKEKNGTLFSIIL